MTARDDRHGAGGRDGGSSCGWQERAGMTRSQQRGLISHRGSWGLPPSPPQQPQPSSSLPSAPHHWLPPRRRDSLQPIASPRRGGILAAVVMATGLPSSPAHGTQARATGEVAAGCSASSGITCSPGCSAGGPALHRAEKEGWG